MGVAISMRHHHIAHVRVSLLQRRWLGHRLDALVLQYIFVPLDAKLSPPLWTENRREN